VSDWMYLLPLATASAYALRWVVIGLLAWCVIRRGGAADLMHVADLVRAWRGRDRDPQSVARVSLGQRTAVGAAFDVERHARGSRIPMV
jgi:hypothetical protein